MVEKNSKQQSIYYIFGILFTIAAVICWSTSKDASGIYDRIIGFSVTTFFTSIAILSFATPFKNIPINR